MTSPGTVYLVGAGPGDPGLITLRGWQLLQSADMVLYDGLVNPLLLRHTSATAVRTCRVDGPDGRRINQDEINAQLIAAAKQGLRVVRLKGGDPFVFGRGAEEAAALRAEGIPFEVVPGVTAAVAAGAYAGVSLTHRARASAVALITGHEDPRKTDFSLDYAALARFPGTLVFYMGLHRLPDITRQLIQAGMPGSTPAGVISRGSLASQKTVIGTVATLANDAATAGLRPPSIVIVGDCVNSREHLTWFEHKPLFGQRIGITRSPQQAERQIEQVLLQGGHPVVLPCVETGLPVDPEAIDAVIRRRDRFDWVLFTSSEAVRCFASRLFALKLDARWFAGSKIGCVGSSTANTLRETLCLVADVVPAVFNAAALAAEIGPSATGKSILWVRGSRVRDVLRTELTAAGATVHELIAYETRDVERWPESTLHDLRSNGLDWICLSSPAVARQIAKLLPGETQSAAATAVQSVSISPQTTAEASACGFGVTCTAEVATWDGMFAAIAVSLGRKPDQTTAASILPED